MELIDDAELDLLDDASPGTKMSIAGVESFVASFSRGLKVCTCCLIRTRASSNVPKLGETCLLRDVPRGGVAGGALLLLSEFCCLLRHSSNSCNANLGGFGPCRALRNANLASCTLRGTADCTSFSPLRSLCAFVAVVEELRLGTVESAVASLMGPCAIRDELRDSMVHSLVYSLVLSLVGSCCIV